MSPIMNHDWLLLKIQERKGISLIDYKTLFHQFRVAGINFLLQGASLEANSPSTRIKQQSQTT